MAAMTKERQAQIEAWTWEWFQKNPGASQHACLRAANNARIGTFPNIVRAVHQRWSSERMQSMLVHPAKPETTPGPRLVSPEWVEENDSPRVEAHKESNVASNELQKRNEEQDLREAGRVLLAAMRAHGIEQVLMTVNDIDNKPRAEWELTYKKRSAGASDL